MASRYDHLAVISKKLKAAYFVAYGEAAGDLPKLRAAHATIDKRVQLFGPCEGEPAPRKPPAKRKPSLPRTIRQAEKVPGKVVKEASQRPDGTIVLQFLHNLDDNCSPTIKSEGDNEWDIVLRQ
jgi:hypothetical protein